MGKLILALLLTTYIAGSLQSPTPTFKTTDELIDYINGFGTTWKAGKNFDDSYPIESLRKLSGVPSKRTTPYPKQPEVDPSFAIPEKFDAREQWPDCLSVKEIRDQGACGSCWAFAVVEAISDRICIASQGKQQVEISGENLLACCDSCGDGCEGGFPESAWQYYQRTGLVSGGLYDSKVGCQPYSIKSCEHHVSGHLPACAKDTVPTPECSHSCRSGFNGTYTKDLHFGAKVYGFSNQIREVQADIMKNGPVVATFDTYDDFLTYKSGVYHHVGGGVPGGHAVKIIGWGVESGVDYWLVANSWNPDWGQKGLFKIRRGNDECSFESDISAGLPKL